MNRIAGAWFDFLGAVQFLTRVPTPSLPYDEGSLARSVKFFPFVGLLIGVAAAALLLLLEAHLPAMAASVFTVAFLVLVTGCFHEDALADAADAFGGGRNPEHILAILKDSRIGSYGGAALVLNFMARVSLLAALPPRQIAPLLISAHVLCRWTTLPLSYFVAPAAEAGQGARIARLTNRKTLIAGTLFSFLVVAVALRTRAIAAIAVALLMTWVSGRFYQRKIGGVTGDCFGATNQLTETFVYLCGVWV
jgi:adenosylcobinamide-GDP ribazoletransferase